MLLSYRQMTTLTRLDRATIDMEYADGTLWLDESSLKDGLVDYWVTKDGKWIFSHKGRPMWVMGKSDLNSSQHQLESNSSQLSPLMQRFKDGGLLGCFDGTGVTSENCKKHIDKVYIVVDREALSSEEILGVFCIRKKAIDFIETQGNYDGMVVEEWEVK